jgi:hypothetical protein
VPFVAIVLPAVFILGLFTAVRLVDSNLEGIPRPRSSSPASSSTALWARWAWTRIGAGVALVLMAAFFAYQKWRYDSAKS